MKRQIIRYITGFPLGENPEVRKLDEVSGRYSLSKETAEVWARQRSTRVPVSFYQRYGRSKKDLTDKSKILVFMDNDLAGNVRFRNRNRDNDRWAGYTETGLIVAEVLGEKADEYWTFWGNTPIRWIADTIIREEILRENTKGFSYRHK